jgi:hypothetical protein
MSMIGNILPPCEITSPLGRGGMGEIERAGQEKLQNEIRKLAGDTRWY